MVQNSKKLNVQQRRTYEKRGSIFADFYFLRLLVWPMALDLTWQLFWLPDDKQVYR